MDTVTYPGEKVAAFVRDQLIPLRIRSDAEPYAADFGVTWTPCLIVLGPDGREHHRSVGFLPPEEFIPAMLLGMAKVDFDTGCHEESLRRLERVLQEYPSSGAAPEAEFLKGVNGYKQSGSPQPLKDAYRILQDRYPTSEWAKRAAPYRLL